MVAFGSGPGRCPYRLRHCLGDAYRMPILRDRAVTRLAFGLAALVGLLHFGFSAYWGLGGDC